MTPLSKCCGAPVRVEHGCDSDTGHGGKPCDCGPGATSYYFCGKCKRPADIDLQNYIFRKDGDQWCCHDSDFINLQESPAGFGRTRLSALIDFIKNQEQPPMGVSQWMEHGKKYGYWEYCGRKLVKSFLSDLSLRQIGLTEEQLKLINDKFWELL